VHVSEERKSEIDGKSNFHITCETYLRVPGFPSFPYLRLPYVFFFFFFLSASFISSLSRPLSTISCRINKYTVLISGLWNANEKVFYRLSLKFSALSVTMLGCSARAFAIYIPYIVRNTVIMKTDISSSNIFTKYLPRYSSVGAYL